MPRVEEQPCGNCGQYGVRYNRGGYGDLPGSWSCPHCFSTRQEAPLKPQKAGWQKPHLDGDLWDAIQEMLSITVAASETATELARMTNRYQRGRTWAEMKENPYGA